MRIKSQVEACFEFVDIYWYRPRIVWMMIIVLAMFFLMASRLFYLQIIRGEHYYTLSENNCIRLQRVKPFRGLICDRNGRILVENRPSFDLRIIPRDAKPLETTLDNLARYLHLPVEDLALRVSQSAGSYSYRPVTLMEDISRTDLAMVSAHRFDLPGVIIDCNPRRHYLYDGFAAHLIGYLGEITADELNSGGFKHKQRGDTIGRAGIEKVYDQDLSGLPGGRVVQVNAIGQLMKILDTVPPASGHDIHLTIDYDLQKKANELLLGLCGAVVAMDPFTGEVLAMASSPVYSQNSFADGISIQEWDEVMCDPGRPMFDKALQGEYPPASTYKIVTAIAGLEEGLCDTGQTVFCPGKYKFGNRYYGCWKEHGHGSLNLIDAISESCDVYFYQLARRLGVDQLASYARACGLGAKTGIDLGAESSGLVPTSQWKQRRFGVPWQAGETLSIAIGQGYNLATPLQMVVLTAAVANGGTLYRPSIISTVRSVEGTDIMTESPEKVGVLPVSPENLAIVKKGLWKVVNSEKGTARRYVSSNHVEMSGKTGTAQVISRKADDHEIHRKDAIRPHAWFVGYAPSENPQIAVAVLIEHGGAGSSTAGPIAREVMLSWLSPEIETEITAAAVGADIVDYTDAGSASEGAGRKLISESLRSE
ncbi:MAG: penicillin-binding protein 2 [Desulfobacteraceae bacterium]|jgi:penicillin-binding protein 2|nr:MAG: penicillin-binding protein 2 [Desulfobacteraceae bacterium]